MKLKRPLLLPFSPLYYLGISLRNALFTWKIKKIQSFDIPIISVGNLSVGGTGKTPVALFLSKYFIERNKKVQVISRGYGRKSKGFLWDKNSDVTAQTFGDEPTLLKKRLPEISIAVDEVRANAIEKILEKDRPDVIILDDAYQHQYVHRDLNILLTTWQEPFYKDFLLPAGNLREPRKNAERSDFIWVTKTPFHTSTDEVKKKISSLGKPMCFSAIKYGQPYSLETTAHPPKGEQPTEKFLLVTGLANPSPLLEHLKEKGNSYCHLAFPDHHQFTDQDYQKIKEGVASEKAKYILTTEKDMVRLNPKKLTGIPIWVQPIEVEILEGEDYLKSELDKLVF